MYVSGYTETVSNSVIQNVVSKKHAVPPGVHILLHAVVLTSAMVNVMSIDLEAEVR